MIGITKLTFCGGISSYSSHTPVQRGNEMHFLTGQGCLLAEKSGGIGLGELFEAFQGVAHPALSVDFLEPFQTLG